MSFLLNIHTATKNAIISITENEKVLKYLINTDQKDHASFLQPAIKQLLEESNLNLQQMNAISVTAGPGSYTGLRVGMASAKGLCFALKIPLITLNTLEVMALSVIDINPKSKEKIFFCPMIDARRMEIFTAIYDDQLNEILSPCAMILTGDSMDIFLRNIKINFFGDGSNKASLIIKNLNAIFIDSEITHQAIAINSYEKFTQSNFANISNSQPLYIKELYTISRPVS